MTNDQDRGVDPAITQAMAGLPADFDGFDRVFEREIRPALLEREADRAAAADRAKRWSLFAALGGAAGAGVGIFVFSMPQIAIASAIAAGLAAFVGWAPLNKIKKEAKTLIVGPIAARFGLDYQAEPGSQHTILDMRRVKLVPNYHRSKFEDRLSGYRKGVAFEFFEAKLEERRRSTDSNGRTRTRWVTVFRGQCLRFDFHKRFFGSTLVTRDAGIFNRFGGGGGMERARLEDPQFEKAFEVYTTDQVECRYLLTPDFMQRLVDLETAFRGKSLRCAFDGGEMFLAVEGADLFEPGGMFTPLDNPKRVRELIDDFAVVFNLLDALAKGRDAEAEARGAPSPQREETSSPSPWS